MKSTTYEIYAIRFKITDKITRISVDIIHSNWCKIMYLPQFPARSWFVGPKHYRNDRSEPIFAVYVVWFELSKDSVPEVVQKMEEKMA